jgi:tetratricopeptide (TPR) repeat protein
MAVMKRFPILLSLLLGAFLLVGADGCSSDPNVEGAKLDLRSKDYDRALQNLATALEKDPANAEAYELKGRVLSEKATATPDQAEHIDLIMEMVEAFKSATSIDPTYTEAVTNSMRFSYVSEFQRGTQAFNRGRNDDSEFLTAARYFRSAADIMPDSSGAYVNEAFSYMNGKSPESAIGPFEDALAAGDTDPDNYRLLSGLYQSNDRMDDSIELLETVSTMYPEDGEIQSELLNAYQISGQIDKALDRYRTAVENDPENSLYRYDYGSLLVQAGQNEPALEQLQAAIAIDPNYSNAHFNIGAVYINQAVEANERVKEVDDKLRAERSDLSRDQIDEREAAIDVLVDERRDFFALAIAPLETARELFEANEEDVTDVCRALFQSYAQTNQTDKAQEVSECAGYEDN